METEVCRLKKAYGRKKEEFERACAKEGIVKSSSTDVKPSDSNSCTYPKHAFSSDSEIILLDREAPNEIENQLGAEETSEAHNSKEQTQHAERPEQTFEDESSCHSFGSESSVLWKENDSQSGQEVPEVLLAENTDTGLTSQRSQSQVFIELEALNCELQELQENSLNLMKDKASLVSQTLL